MIEQAHFPFMPKMRVIGEEVEAELRENIKKMAEFYKLDATKMSANITLQPDPIYGGHYLSATVTYYGEVSKQ